MYPRKKEQTLKLLNDVINIMLTGKLKNNNFGEAVYSSGLDSVSIIEPMLDLRIALSDAVADIYGIDKIDFFEKLFEPVISQGNDFDVADKLHSEIISYFSENPNKIAYIEHYKEIKDEI